MDRQAFVCIAAGALVAVPSTSHEQSMPKVRRIGLLTAGTAASLPASLFTEMRELGWVEGQNLLIERRTGDGQANRVPALAAELVQLRVDVIVTFGAVAGLAAKKATAAIQIVATTGDPVAFGLVSNMSRPGGNITGIALVAPQLAATVSVVDTKLIPGGTNRRRLRAYDFVEIALTVMDYWRFEVKTTRNLGDASI